MFKTSLMDETGKAVTLKSGDRVRFEKLVSAILISIYPAGQFKTYFFVTGETRDDKHMITCTVTDAQFNTFCAANMALFCSLAFANGFKPIRANGDLPPNVRVYEIR